MKTAIDRMFLLDAALLRNHLRGDNLKGQCCRGYKDEKRVDCSGVPVAGRPQEARESNVVNEIRRGCEA